MLKEKEFLFLKLLPSPFFITFTTIVKNFRSDLNKKPSFKAVGLDKHLENLYKKCSVIIKLPKESIKNETATVADNPHIHFHIDKIKRAAQNIMTIKNHISPYQDAILVKSEKTEDIKEEIIALTSGIRHPYLIFILTDNSPGFLKLTKNLDKTLLVSKFN